MKPPIYIESLVPYQPGKPIEETKREYGLSKVYKMASNENPLGPPKSVIKVISEVASEIHLYPDASFYETKKALSSYFETEEKNLTLGNGSNELIDLLIRTYCKPGDKILTSKGAFIAYKICAQAANIETVETDLTKRLKFDVDAILEKLDSDKDIKILFIANPNNPTGSYLNKTEVDKLMSAVGHREDLFIVFDEAYNEFVRAKDYAPGSYYFNKYKNVVILRTLSKVFALAGLRVGAMIAQEDVIGYVNRVRNPFNVNVLAQKAAVAAVKEVDYLKESQELVWESLDFFYKEFQRMGLKHWSSQGNFVLFDTGNNSIEVYTELLKNGLILRPLKGYGFHTELRMSIGTMEENREAIKILKKVLRG